MNKLLALGSALLITACTSPVEVCLYEFPSMPTLVRGLGYASCDVCIIDKEEAVLHCVPPQISEPQSEPEAPAEPDPEVLST